MFLDLKKHVKNSNNVGLYMSKFLGLKTTLNHICCPLRNY